MNDKAIKILEFDKIREMLVHLAGSDLGRRRCAALMPTDTREQAEAWQQETEDALTRTYSKGSLSFSGIPDIGDSLLRLERGGCLQIPELLRIGSLLTAVARAKAYGCPGDRGDDVPEDSLSERFNMLQELRSEKQEITRCIISEEEIADDASAGLKSVRRKMKATNDKIHERLGSILSAASQAGMIQDALITMRDGRYCLPYKSEYKNQVAGMVHDQSASGSTSFIEPMEIVKLNNELRELEIAEAEEIQKVLAALSEMLAPYTEDLRYDREVMTELDFIFARAYLAKEMKAVRPEFSDDRSVKIVAGRHPLIDPKKVVPIDIAFGQSYSMVVITGPNTGGKTVSLKTVGLFTLMGQAGLHVPAKHGTVLGIFPEVFADIGDEQSIEQSLSTFSSHMTNTVKILEQAEEDSLVLFDELGAGTDPTEGAALAMAILSRLHRFDIRTMATTHYAELKVFAMTTEGVINACCEFDVESLRPTYRLLMGIPGKSNAFAISKRLGLPDEIIAEADSYIGIRDKSFEDMIAGLEETRLKLEEELSQAKADRRETALQRSEWEKKNKAIEERKDRIIADAKAEAGRVLQDAKDFADETIRRINKLGTSGANMAALEDERRKTREKLNDTVPQNELKKEQKKGEHKAEEFRIGDSVLVLSMNTKGTIHTLPNAKGDCFVTMGIMTTKVNIRDLAILETPKEDTVKKVFTATGIGNKAMTISPELNLVGKRTDEAVAELDKYLDDAYLAHIHKVTIIHGRGTGAVRQAVHQHCKRTKYVKSYTISPDYGSTEVEFKD
ncbi:MAG: endonuclease MutS2 [Lachnospiraceae bacterium]|nr:endonuclease MutS2 [Lachnospiraceae bacterium]